jgi:endoglucanase
MKKLLFMALIIALSMTACPKGDGSSGDDLVDSDIRYKVSQTGGADFTADTTGITFTFDADIDNLNVSIDDITVGGTASKGTAAFTGSGKSWTLSPITVSSAGRAMVSIQNKARIQTKQKYFTIYKSGEYAPSNGISAVALVAEIRVGWNLGNTFDASSGSGYSSGSVDSLETAWVKTKTTQALIDALYSGGFNAIRIPVTWYKVANPADGYKIRADWITRVKEVVDYAVKNDMYIILNTHHDESLFKFKNADYKESLDAFEKIWEQIADAFMDYDEHLIFEGLNEPRTRGSDAEWSGGTPEERANLNKYHQILVDVVRESGGNNYKRLLLLNPYAASAESAAMNGLALPTDTVEKKLIVSYHSYSPYNFALNQGDGKTGSWSKSNSSDTSAISSHINRYNTAFISKGIPVMIGEFGAMNRNNVEARAEWAEYYVGQAKAKGIPCFWWDNGNTTGSGELFGLLNRSTHNFDYPEIVNALMKGTE